jgi:hypothetical protein
MVKLFRMARDSMENALSQREFASLGGKARREKLTPEERKRIAQLAAKARWAKKAGAPGPPDPTDPKGPHRDQQHAEAGIMYSRRRPAVSATTSRLNGRSRAAAA